MMDFQTKKWYDSFLEALPEKNWGRVEAEVECGLVGQVLVLEDFPREFVERQGRQDEAGQVDEDAGHLQGAVKVQKAIVHLHPENGL